MEVEREKQVTSPFACTSNTKHGTNCNFKAIQKTWPTSYPGRSYQSIHVPLVACFYFLPLQAEHKKVVTTFMMKRFVDFVLTSFKASFRAQSCWRRIQGMTVDLKDYQLTSICFEKLRQICHQQLLRVCVLQRFSFGDQPCFYWCTLSSKEQCTDNLITELKQKAVEQKQICSPVFYLHLT